MAMIRVVKEKAEARAAREEERLAKTKAAMASMVSSMVLLGHHPQSKVDGQLRIGLNGTKTIEILQTIMEP